MDAFFDLLFSDARGLCFACNMLDSVQAPLFSADRFRRFMGCVFSEFQRDLANMRTTAEAIGLVSRVASGFCAGHVERHVMVAAVPTPRSEGRLAHALRSETLSRWTQSATDSNLILEPRPSRTPAAVSAYNLTIRAINDEIKRDPEKIFDQDSSIGYDVPAQGLIALVWFTRADALRTVSSGDDLRDCLGLDTHLGAYYLVATFENTAVHKSGVARTTFADGGNTRFRILSDGPTDSLWGTTVNLGKLLRDESVIDGAPERVSAKIPLRDLKPRFESFDWLGWVDSPRGTSPTDSDEAFQERLLRGRSSGDVRAAIERLLT